MDAAAYCRDKATPEGSTLYYALLYVDPEQRATLTSLYALLTELRALAVYCSEPAVARAKLAWWRDELVRVNHGKAAHPVGQAVQATIQRQRLDGERFFGILEGVAMDLERYRYRSFAQLEQYCKRTGGELGRLAALATGASSQASSDFAGRLGVGYLLTDLVMQCREHLARGNHYLPVDDLEEHAVSEAELREFKTTPHIRSLFASQVERAARCLRDALKSLPGDEYRANQYAITLGALSEASLKAVIRAQYRVLEHPISLTPIRKLWLAWSLDLRLRRAEREKKGTVY